MKDFVEAKKIFELVYDNKDTPYEIRNSVIFFLNNIDNEIGYIRPNISIFKEKNPGRDPGSGQHLLFGTIPVNYDSNNMNNKKVYGATLEIQGGKIISENTFAGFELRTKSYFQKNNEENKINDSRVFLNYKINDILFVSPSYYIFEKDGQDYHLASNSFNVVKKNEFFDINYSYSIGHQDYRFNKDANSNRSSNIIGATFIINDFEVIPSLGREIISARDDQYSLVNNFQSLKINRNFYNRRFLAEIDYFKVNQDSKEVDPLWAIKRSDEQYNYNLSICDRTIVIFSYFACIGYSKTENYSNNSIYNYNNNQIKLTFRK
jgi:hypothetical protein